MNLTELLARTRRHLSEGGSAVFPDPLITSQLNTSARSLAAQHGLLHQRATVTTTDGVAYLPDVTVGVRRVYHNTGRFYLTPMPAARAPMPGEYTGGGRPYAYVYDPSYGPLTLAVYPTTGSHTLTVDVLSSGTPMADAADQPWDGAWPEFHGLIAWHAAHHLSGQRGATGAAQAVYLQRYQQAMDEMKGAVAMQTLDTLPQRPPSRAPSRRRGWY